MKSKKDHAIAKILKEFEDFATLTLHQLDLLEKIMNVNNNESSSEIIKEMKKNETKLDNYEIRISEKIVNTIALYHPVASDIRKIIACYRILINLERIGDQIMNILYNLDKMKDPSVFVRSSELIDNMLIQSSSMVSKALISFTNNDKEYAIWTIKNDNIIDELNKKLLKKTIAKSNLANEQQELLYSFMNIKTILSSIERIADHATNIAEASIYSMEGTDIRHQQI
jgi:phosphate transport system protein